MAILKKIIAVIFLIAFATQIFSKVVIIVNFYLNQKYIAENLCVNKAKPAMRCCGRCQLSKKLNQEDHKDQQNPNRRVDNEVLSSKSFFASYHCTITSEKVNLNSFYNTLKLSSRSAEVFHPPTI